MAKRLLRFRELGRLPYKDGLAVQQRYHDEVVGGADPILLSLEHDPVYTLGRRDAPDRFLAQPPMPIPVVKTDRGGEITYHGPGQAVIYIFVRLDAWRLKLPDLVCQIEKAIIDTGAAHGFSVIRKQGWRGVFVGDAKLASIGLSVHRDVTMHGLALNVENDLTPFQYIHPCGLPIQMCSLHTLGAAESTRAAAAWQVAEYLAGSLRAKLIVDAPAA
jgi:lipoyl(octanoyl) transferase